ncbi:MAG TPA: glycosyltransferase, partial [Steroidobacteraceae bacterium]
MQILMISDVYFPRVNGVSTSIHTFREDLLALGVRCALVAPRYPQSPVVPDRDVVRVRSRGVPRDPEDRAMVWRELLERAQRLAHELRPDVVHIQTPFLAHYAGVRIARALAAPLVETYHTYFEHYLHYYVPLVPSSWIRGIARRFTRSQCAQVDVVISPSKPMAAALRDYGVRTRLEVLPTGLDAGRFAPGDRARFRAAHGIAAARPVMLFVGRVAFEKNIDFLLDVLPAVRAQIPDVLLAIAGEGPACGHLKRRVAAEGLERNVMFIGYLKRDDELLDCYRAADIFVFASRTETQGLVLLEAMAQGTPVVSTAVMGTADVLEGTKGAVIVPEKRA